MTETNRNVCDDRPQEKLRALLGTICVRFMYQASPHLQQLLTWIFRFAFDERDHYDVVNETPAMKTAFYTRVVAAGGDVATHSTHGKVPNMGPLEPSTVRALADIYISKRKEYKDNRKGVTEQGQGQDTDEVENKDKDGANHTKKEGLLLKSVDQWIEWVEVQKDLLQFLDSMG
ncbi:Uu.00g016200.m01.CDS01 [Anthostomella pinea]|uniref:Uu.00g016200.m01.CDS01 n=1 Tax=Anthostomella pinea TaxID=933095 RepID=A0AAI8VYP4_9PEZI|nr:Uu.00g016200.m01.CDS01 [Anthostomella pinea]